MGLREEFADYLDGDAKPTIGPRNRPTGADLPAGRSRQLPGQSDQTNPMVPWEKFDDCMEGENSPEFVGNPTAGRGFAETAGPGRNPECEAQDHRADPVGQAVLPDSDPIGPDSRPSRPGRWPSRILVETHRASAVGSAVVTYPTTERPTPGAASGSPGRTSDQRLHVA